MYSMQLRSCLITFLLLITSSAFSQSVNPTSLKNMLCNKWVQDKVEDNGVTIPRDNDASEFDLIFNDDGTVQQGMAPDGFISGAWTADDNQMTVTISDLTVNTSYTLKILRITENLLIVQYTEGGHLLTMYYHRATN
jgi:hypothetical protein